MKICVVGAGAIGGLLAVKLADAGESVSLVARGAHLAAIRKNGLTLIDESGERTAHLQASDTMSELGPQDLVILGLKAHQVADVALQLPVLFGPDTAVLTAQNGIPWWYFFKHGGPFENRTLESVDPGGRIARGLPIERVIASVVYPAAEITAPGRIRHIEGNRFSLSELDHAQTPRIAAVSDAFRRAGFKAPVVSDIRAEIWTKLWGNLSFNPISALTHATLEDLCRHPLTRDLATAMMAEAQAIGEKLGIRFRISIERRIAAGEAVGPHKTSMLQDVEAGRALEADALIGSMIELGRLTQTPTPSIDAIYALIKLLGDVLSKSDGRLRLETRQI